ncbi:MAG: helix-turn-helix domain-containing protein [Pseudomonadota bacterium]
MSKNKKIVNALPPMIKQRLETLGKNIEIARKRRGFSQEYLSRLAMVNRNTIRRLEKGDPGVSMALVATVLWVLQLDENMDNLAHPDQDQVGLSFAKASMKNRIHMKTEDEHDF